MSELEDYIQKNLNIPLTIPDANTWDIKRKKIALEQLFYVSKGLETGAIDGLFGPQTAYAREYWNTKQTKPDLVVDNWRDNHTKWPLQKDVLNFYGPVGSNQTQCNLPFPMVIAWEPTKKINSYSCHIKVKEPMERIWKRTLDYYGYDKIVQLRLNYFGGSLNVRKMRGGSTWSMHSWGIAVDIDPDRNQLRMTKSEATLSKPEYEKFWQFVYDEGAISLGKERNFDWMHFQFARL